MTHPNDPTQWHYAADGQRFGPVSTEEIAGLVRQGTLNGQSLVWSPAMAEWQPLASTSLASTLGGMSAPPPLTGGAVKNDLVWVLAFAPIIGLFLEGFASGLTGIAIDSLWFITLLLNVGLSTADEKRLVAAGHDTSQMGASWLVPVYLYKRAEVLRQPQAYFWVWCALFALILFA